MLLPVCVLRVKGRKVEAATTKLMMWADGVGVKCVVIDGRMIKQESIQGFKLGDIGECSNLIADKNLLITKDTSYVF